MNTSPLGQDPRLHQLGAGHGVPVVARAGNVWDERLRARVNQNRSRAERVCPPSSAPSLRRFGVGRAARGGGPDVPHRPVGRWTATRLTAKRRRGDRETPAGSTFAVCTWACYFLRLRGLVTDLCAGFARPPSARLRCPHLGHAGPTLGVTTRRCKKRCPAS